MRKTVDNNAMLRKLWENSGLTQDEALLRINKGQVRGIKPSTFKAYMAAHGVARRRECPSEILAHAQKVLTRAAAKA